MWKRRLKLSTNAFHSGLLPITPPAEEWQSSAIDDVGFLEPEDSFPLRSHLARQQPVILGEHKVALARHSIDDAQTREPKGQ